MKAHDHSNSLDDSDLSSYPDSLYELMAFVFILVLHSKLCIELPYWKSFTIQRILFTNDIAGRRENIITLHQFLLETMKNILHISFSPVTSTPYLIEVGTAVNYMVSICLQPSFNDKSRDPLGFSFTEVDQ
jgi:hypothetical protein